MFCRFKYRTGMLRFFTSIFIFTFILLVTCALTGCSREAPPVKIDIDAAAGAIAETKTGEILFAKNADKRYPPASTTKVMTAIVAIEHMGLEEEIIPGDGVLQVEPTVIELEPGVSYSLKDLILAILIKSANDAAVAIAEGVAGSEERFVDMMNLKAGLLGMEDTHFETATGLPTGVYDRQYTTAGDLVKMMRYAIRYGVILEALSQKENYISGSDGKEIYLKTHNRVLLRSDDAPWGKTGYTIEARRTFVGADPSFSPRIVFSLLKSDDLWGDITEMKIRGIEAYKRRHTPALLRVIKWFAGLFRT